MLLQADCTVTMVHSRTVCPEEEIAEADIVVAALGKASWLRGSWLKPGAVVLDVGINHAMRPDGSVDLVGDVAFDEAVKVAAAITPVPGGVGPMTVAYLLHNTVKAMCYQKQIYFPRDTESGNR
jgi:methylenetetrahydrofolate dehydrogenase (NADP+)/methenyltetrahydrofolate cyclohydrolase